MKLIAAVAIVWLALSFDPEPVNMRGMAAQHNVWRAKVGVEPLQWSDALAREAQEWADHLASKGCKMEHRPATGKWGTKHGENIFWASNMRVTPALVVDAWAEEIQYYDTATGKCSGGVCGHYTQVVWRATRLVGCGMARCGIEEVWVCNYDPPGNFVGQRPY